MTDDIDQNPRLEKARSLWQRTKSRIWWLLHHEDSPQRIARGMGLGVFLGILPLMGIQMALAALFAFPFRANMRAALAAVWLSNPITFIPFYWANYRFGLFLNPHRRVSWGEFSERLHQAADWQWGAIGKSLMNLMGVGADVLVPLWTGSVVTASFFSLIAYLVTHRWVLFYRRKIKHHE